MIERLANGRSRRSKHRRGAAFALIELPVVIAIIAILPGMLSVTNGQTYVLPANRSLICDTLDNAGVFSASSSALRESGRFYRIAVWP